MNQFDSDYHLAKGYLKLEGITNNDVVIKLSNEAKLQLIAEGYTLTNNDSYAIVEDKYYDILDVLTA